MENLDFKIGDRIQVIISDNYQVAQATVLACLSAKVFDLPYYKLSTEEQAMTVEHYNIKYDDGNEEIIPYWSANKLDNELESEFRNLFASTKEEIDKELDLAMQHLRNAVVISDKHCIPFRSNISFLSNEYVPASFRKSKFSKLDDDFLQELNIYVPKYRDNGWTTSDVC